MSARRTFFAIAASTFAFLGFARSADAAAPLTVDGRYVLSQGFAKSGSSHHIGGGFQLYGRVDAVDYQAACKSLDTKSFCKGVVGSAAINDCTLMAASYVPRYCGKTGGEMIAQGYAGADVSLFGKELDLFALEAQAASRPSGGSTSFRIAIVGKTLMSQSRDAVFEDKKDLGERILVAANSTFMIGPVPITVGASACGNMGIDFALEAGTNSVTGKATPWVRVDGIVSAGVGTSGVGFGVSGELLLAKFSTPATATLSKTGDRSFQGDASLDLRFDALDGEVNLWAKAGPLKKDWTIFSWNGIHVKENLGHKSRSFEL